MKRTEWDGGSLSLSRRRLLLSCEQDWRHPRRVRTVAKMLFCSGKWLHSKVGTVYRRQPIARGWCTVWIRLMIGFVDVKICCGGLGSLGPECWRVGALFALPPYFSRLCRSIPCYCCVPTFLSRDSIILRDWDERWCVHIHSDTLTVIDVWFVCLEGWGGSQRKKPFLRRIFESLTFCIYLIRYWV